MEQNHTRESKLKKMGLFNHKKWTAYPYTKEKES